MFCVSKEYILTFHVSLIMKSLNKKLNKIRTNSYKSTDFIIADAKDGEMGGGAQAPGPKKGKNSSYKSYTAYLQAMREMVESRLVDVMLMSVYSAEILFHEGCFSKSPVTAAVRLNDTTDIWGLRGSNYNSFPSKNVRTASLERVKEIADLGLYSITFSNNVEKDVASLQGLKDFQVEELAGKPALHVVLKYFDGKPVIGTVRRVSKPSLRIYRGSGDLPTVRGGLGVAIVSTSQGVMTDRAARKAGVGGEVICEIF